MRIFGLIILMLFCSILPARAQLAEYADLYKVDMNEELPLLWRLQEEYESQNSQYNWKYDFNWKIPTNFDVDFKQDIKNFATVEKRLNNPDEEDLLRDIKRIPKAFYPYIGPLLHTVRGLSGKILDLPGIKGTKNKFPERIAAAVEDIPDVEFVSPALYVYLSPQFWGEDMKSLEFPQLAKNQDENLPNVRINPQFMQKIKQKVKASDFGAGKKSKPVLRGFRHFEADINTPLSNADVEAFVATFEALDKFKEHNDNEERLIMITPLMDYWDEKNGVPAEITFLKQVVNPCQSIVRKVRWSGLQHEFLNAVGPQGFGMEEWAYTCDKALKAYRVHTMPQGFITTIKLLRTGYYYQFLDKVMIDAEEKRRLRYFMEALIWLYDTNLENIEAIKPYSDELGKKIYELDTHFAGTPVLLP